ncbi:hypothetical protein [Fusobacterium sp. HMSC073F01]|uniref:hypothetical protein n=1 Tax=Fusobacterium sp. HMSC073F01 TaxID=1739251 RepID=UPI0008A539AB|nr:hypothetical protein [Fusobacterium sp. HMSC073F01]OFL94193.1 hypothetical protein HMPREF2747_16160 [Fusobacterium sp. HMSC073F01]
MSNKNSSTTFKEILDFHEQTLGKSDAEKRNIAKSQNIDFDEYQRRILGKEKEMEFFIIMRATRSFKDIKPIDEELAQISGEKTPDYEVEFTDGYKMMVEVKHTDKEEYKISGGNLQKRIDYANAHNLPLRFAISIKGFWGLLTSDFIKNKNGKILVSDFGGKERNSWFDRELATCSYMFSKPLKIVSIYAKETTEGLGILFEPYGELISYELYCSDRLILKIEGNDISKIWYLFTFEAIQDRLANISQEITENGNLTTIVEDNNRYPLLLLPEYLFILAPIRHIQYSEKNSKDNIFITATEEDNAILSVEYIRAAMSDLCDLGVYITCFRDGYGYEFNDYRSKFWTKNRDEINKDYSKSLKP